MIDDLRVKGKINYNRNMILYISGNFPAEMHQGNNVINTTTQVVSKTAMMDNAKMCVNHKSSLNQICYPAPGQIADYRKHKRRCLGLHPMRIMFDKALEINHLSAHTLRLALHFCHQSTVEPVETVWGGGGQRSMRGDDATEFVFTEDFASGVRSSVQTGQIPLLYYI